MSLGWVGAEGLNVIDFQGQQASEEWTYCSKVWPYCVNNPTACTFVGVCNNCVQFLPKSVKGCCQQNPPASCFQNILSGGGGSGSQEDVQQSLSASPVPSASASITDTNAAVCATALAAISACEAATSGFDSLDATSQASCLCYDTATSYMPSVFDDAWSYCAVYASTADTSDYPAVTSALGLCRSAGDVRGGSDATVTTGGGSPVSTPTATTASVTATTAASGSSASMASASSAASGSTSRSSSSGARASVRLSGLLILAMSSLAMFV